MIHMGIDPGRQGAFALLDLADMTVAVQDMPDTISGLHDLLIRLPVIHSCCVEKPFYPRMVGTKTVAVMAENYGALKSALLWRDVPFFEVAPAKWKKHLGLTSDKAQSRAKATQLFPGSADQWHLKKHDGRAEAALIAWYGSRGAK